MKKIYLFILIFCFGVLIQNSKAQNLSINLSGTYATGVFDEGAAEIVSYSKDEEKLYFVNADAVAVEIIDISDPANPNNVGLVDVSLYGASANSVSVGSDFFVVAVENDSAQLNGKLVFYDLLGNYITDVDAGALPDFVGISPDENYVVVANEGEPSDMYNHDPEGSVTIVDISGGVQNITSNNVSQVDFTSLNGTVFTDGTRIFGNNGNATVAEDLEPEYVAFNPNSTIAYVSCQENNTVITVNLVSGTVTAINGLGFKDHSLQGNGMDASNRSEIIRIQPVPVWGMYQPDAMVTAEINQTTYLFTANEGDARDYDGYSEETRVKDLNLDPIAFPDADSLQRDSVLGRLTTTTANGDADNNGLFEEIYAFGARSFSIWNTSDFSQVYDSGDEFAQTLKIEYPLNFNSTNDDNDSFKNRSDDKGSEPEAIAVGEINGKHYAFIGLERMGGIMVYDVSNPVSPEFILYELNRNFDVDATSSDAGDLGPECLIFIPADQHSSGNNMLVVSNEVSGTVSIYEIDLPTNTEEISETTSFNVYPNPARDILNTGVVGDYVIFDNSGRLVKMVTNTNQININNLQSGLYCIVNKETNEKSMFIVE